MDITIELYLQGVALAKHLSELQTNSHGFADVQALAENVGGLVESEFAVGEKLPNYAYFEHLRSISVLGMVAGLAVKIDMMFRIPWYYTWRPHIYARVLQVSVIGCTHGIHAKFSTIKSKVVCFKSLRCRVWTRSA
jgi:hypothetical protein